MNANQLVTYLNAIGVGDLDGIQAKLDEAGQACVEIEQPDLAEKLVQAGEARTVDMGGSSTTKEFTAALVKALG